MRAIECECACVCVTYHQEEEKEAHLGRIRKTVFLVLLLHCARGNGCVFGCVCMCVCMCVSE